MGINEPKSQSLSLQVQERARWARKLSASCKEGFPSHVGNRVDEVLRPAGKRLWWLMPKGDQHGMEQLCGVWSSAVSAVLWSLPQLYLERGVLLPSEPF